MTRLQLSDVHGYYGRAHVLNGISLDIESGERVALIGRNGAGKTTVVNTVLGFARLGSGEIRIGGRMLRRPRPYDATRLGVAVVPQGRRIIANLTVAENLLLGAACGRQGDWTLDAVYGLFPILQERARTPGTTLSGGQQQMLAVGRALMANPGLLVLDEPTEGLAPAVIDQFTQVLERIAQAGTSLLLVEQNMRVVARVARRYLVLAKGAVAAQGMVKSGAAGLQELEQHIVF